MNQPLTPKRKAKTKDLVTLGIGALALLTTLGFEQGWLALAGDQRPVGKLRPKDLIGAKSQASAHNSLTQSSANRPLPAPTIDDDSPRHSTPDRAADNNSLNGLTGTLKPGRDGDHDADD